MFGHFQTVRNRSALKTHVTQLAFQVSKQHRKPTIKKTKKRERDKHKQKNQRKKLRKTSRQTKKRRGGIPKRGKRKRCNSFWHPLQDTAQSKPLPVCSHTSTQTKLKQNPYKV